ncbi:MAG TPA: ABC transporter ATP-binding protein [Bryobacteraceae bacterium]|nr:ABC transporter ATP-binding protein [Bryobacteraceae bacterium]
MPHVLEIQDAVKTYGSDVRALDGVSLSMEAGQFVTLVGRSGCGKSTLLHLAGAMDFPDSGTVRIAGQLAERGNDAALTRLRREETGFVFQSFQLLPTLSVVENVELPLMLAGRSGADVRRAALESLEDVDMSAYADRMPYQLSGGQMQRVAIARGLVHTPQLLLADEPTGNLDTATGDHVLRLLRAIADAGTAILMATHSAEAAAASHRVVRMRDGRIEA